MIDMTFQKIPTLSECYDLVNSSKSKSFIYKEEILDGVTLVTFSYRLASYSDFNQEGARNLRGITFRKDTQELVALPFHKFFNYKECPFTEESIVREKEIVRIADKSDGSLIIFFMLNGVLYAKTKMNCFAEQAEWAMDIVHNNRSLKDEIISLIDKGFTPMFEFVSPRNKIVIQYTKEELIYLASRNKIDGNYDFKPLKNCKSSDSFVVKTLEGAVSIIQNYKDKEGLVVVFDNFDMMKIKTSDYMSLHKAKDNVFNEKNLVDMILNETIDDVKALFSDSKEILEYISEMEKAIVSIFNNYIDHACTLYNSNKDLSRKDYAIKMQKLSDKMLFGLAMEVYLNGKIDEKRFQERFVSNKLWQTENFNVKMPVSQEEE